MNSPVSPRRAVGNPGTAGGRWRGRAEEKRIGTGPGRVDCLPQTSLYGNPHLISFMITTFGIEPLSTLIMKGTGPKLELWTLLSFMQWEGDACL